MNNRKITASACGVEVIVLYGVLRQKKRRIKECGCSAVLFQEVCDSSASAACTAIARDV